MIVRKESYQVVDILKFILSISIVLLHSNALSIYSDEVEWYVTGLVCRVAVPYFFICSGYFLFRGMSCINIEDRASIKQYIFSRINRLIPPFFVWSLLAFIFPIIEEFQAGTPVYIIALKIIRLYIVYPYGAMWYVLALIIAYYLIYRHYTLRKRKYLYLFAIFGYLFSLLCNSYYFITSKFPLLRGIIDLYLLLFEVPRNGFFVGLPLVLLGGAVYHIVNSFKNSQWFLRNVRLAMFLSYIAYAIELVIVRNKETRGDCSLYFFLPVFATLLCLLNVLEDVKVPFNTCILRRFSTGVYFLHTLLINTLQVFGVVGWSSFFISSILSILICILVDKSRFDFLKRII